MIVILRTHSDIEASLVRGLLESHGIAALLSSDVPHSVFPLSIDGLGEVRIAVRDDQADEAVRIIADHRADEPGRAPVRIHEEFRELEFRLGHRFSDRGLLEHALTHRSRAHEDASGGVTDNESMEFLGDAVVGLVVADMLFREYPDDDEGHKSKLKAALVSATALSGLAERLDLGSNLLLGRGEERSGGRQKPALLANAFEAVVAALYLDGGLEVARAFIAREIRPMLEALNAKGGEGVQDFKSALQEWLQGRGRPLPEYRLVAQRGPDHRKEFDVEVLAGGQVLARATGLSKKTAEQDAAREALAVLRTAEPDPYSGR